MGILLTLHTLLSSRVYNTVLHVIHGSKVHSRDSTFITFRHRAAEISNIIMLCLGENGAEKAGFARLKQND